MLEEPQEPFLVFKQTPYVLNFFVTFPEWEAVLKKYHQLWQQVSVKAFKAADLVHDAQRLDHINIIFCSDDEIHELNKNYRGMDKPTNVLSFPIYDLTELKIQAYGFGDHQFFGDIFIAYDYCLQEAKTINKDFSHHIAHMVTHGILHLLGYDHIEPQDAHIMENLEADILHKFQITNPYET